ncbi:MAG: ATP synthase F1 subunit epsilon [Acidimicrobiaceae bacterium]|nr:ATP synthase F1 subunit epsilon [Acidimicrobiaceae bacterium]|tara:strand:- start:1948 stop:2340 length:393 start_codon:yes stop_codon:yes gene_type:complete
MSLRIELVSPEKIVYEGDAELVIARTSDGEIGFQPGHVPFVGNLVSSVVRVALSDGGVQRIAVHSGFVEVSDNHVALLCDVAELAEDIDIERAKASLESAKSDLANDPSNSEAVAAANRAEVRLEAVAGI